MGGHDLYDAHSVVTACQFAEAWEAMEQGLLRCGLSRAGVSAAQTMATVGRTLGARFTLSHTRMLAATIATRVSQRPSSKTARVQSYVSRRVEAGVRTWAGMGRNEPNCLRMRASVCSSVSAGVVGSSADCMPGRHTGGTECDVGVCRARGVRVERGDRCRGAIQYFMGNSQAHRAPPPAFPPAARRSLLLPFRRFGLTQPKHPSNGS